MAAERINYEAMKALRLRSGFDSLPQFARALRDEEGIDIHPDHLSNIERGHKRPSPTLLTAIARVLRVTKTTLLAHPDEKPGRAA
jgi:transcriptional regulator with XRE-family HTH domain